MQDPVGPSKYNGLSVSPSPFLFAGKKFHLPRPSLSSKGKIQTVIRGVRESRKKQQCRHGAGPGSSWGVCITIWYVSLSSSMELGPAPRWRTVNFRLSTHKWMPDRVESEDWWLIFLDYLPVISPPINQREVHTLNTTSRILSIQASSLKPTVELGSFEHEPLVLLAGSLQ